MLEGGWVWIGIVGLALLVAGPGQAVTLGMVDDFQDGTTQRWGSGGANPTPPSVQDDCGPGGTGDDCLFLQSSGLEQAGGRLVAFNFSQWRGDYTEEGIGRISLMGSNIGTSDLALRLVLDGFGGRFSTQAAALAAGSGWTSLEFDLGDLVSIGGNDAAATLGNVTLVRLLHTVVPAFAGETIEASLLVDDITALPVPEPGSASLLALGLTALAASRRRAA